MPYAYAAQAATCDGLCGSLIRAPLFTTPDALPYLRAAALQGYIRGAEGVTKQ